MENNDLVNVNSHMLGASDKVEESYGHAYKMNSEECVVNSAITTSDLTKEVIDRVRHKGFKLLEDDDYGIIPIYRGETHYLRDIKSVELSKTVFNITNDIIESDMALYFDKNLANKVKNNCNYADKMTPDIVSVFQKELDPIPESEFDKEDDEINTPDGVLNLITSEVRARTDDDLFLHCTEANYIEGYEDEPTFFTEGIRHVIYNPNLSNHENENRFWSLISIYSYFLCGRMMEKLLVIELGASNSGKTTRHKILRYLAGTYAGEMESDDIVISPRSKSEIGINFVENRNKRFVTSAELNSGDTFDGNLLKKISGGDPFFRRKMGKNNQINCCRKAKYLLSSNELPKVKIEKSNAFFKRLLIIQNARSIPDDLKDEEYAKKILTQENIDKIFTFLVNQLGKYYCDGSLYRHESFQTDKLSFLLNQNDPVSLFFDSCVVYNSFNTGQKITITDLYKSFNFFCSNIGQQHSLTRKAFSKRFSEICEPLNIFKHTHDAKHATYYDQFFLNFDPNRLTGLTTGNRMLYCEPQRVNQW